MIIILQAYITQHQSLQKDIYIHICIYLIELLPISHLSTSRTLPHTHTLILTYLNLERLPFYLQYQEIQNLR